MSENHNPLVSVTVITYNSSKFVLETLESVKAQTYENIELIISDDCSTDNTVEICSDWLKNNKDRFVESHIVTSPVNTGIPANKNRAIKMCKGEWLKSIAGDDVLLPNNITQNIKFSTANNCIFVISKLQFFNEKGSVQKESNKKELVHFFSKETVRDKYKSYLRSSIFLNSPSFFYTRELYELNSGFDEDFRLLEDKPFILSTLRNGVDICFLNKNTVKYRLSDSSISGRKNPLLEHDIAKCNEKYIFPTLKNGNFKDYIFFLLLKQKDYYSKKGTTYYDLGHKIANKLFSFLSRFS